MLFGPQGGGAGILSYSQAQRDALAPSNGTVIFNTTSLRVEQYDSTNAIWRAVGSPLAINYITNWDAESDLSTGWTTYADAAQATPVDGTGGSPNVTFATSATTPLRGQADFNFVKDAANRQGQGVSYNFSIDRADQGRVLQIAFDYEVISGTYASGDMTVWVYDVTNAVLLSQPSGNSIISTSIPSQQGQCTFQTSINSTSYRLIFHVTTTSASAYTLGLDNVYVSSQVTNNAPAIFDWVSFTPTGSWSTNTTYSGKYRRVGADVEMQYFLTTAGAPTSAALTVNMPSGLVIDSTQIADPSVGANTRVDSIGQILDSGTAAYSTVLAQYSSTTVLSIRSGNSSAQAADVTQAAPMTWASGDKLWLYVKVPISGWQANAISSSSSNTKPVVFAGTQVTQALTADVTNISFTTAKDTVAGWSTNIYTVQVPGDYDVGANMLSSGASTLQIYINGTVTYTLGVANQAARSMGGQMIIPNLAVGTTISFRSAASVTATVGNVSIALRQNPQQISASESINARYFASATSISGSLATVSWTTKDYDTHNAMASGLYTCPAPGKYEINVAVALAGTMALNNQNILEIQKNSTAVSNETHFVAAVITNDFLSLSDIISCNAGDVIRIQVSSAATLPTIVSSNTRNFVSIARVGN